MMYARISKIALLLCSILSIFACKFATNDGTWTVRNTTGDTIIFKEHFVSYDSKPKQREYKILPNAGFQYKHGEFPKSSIVQFESIIRTNEGTDSITVHDKSGKLLKTWRLSEKESPGKQFFNEHSWEKRIEPQRNKLFDYYWTFTINDDDLSPE